MKHDRLWAAIDAIALRNGLSPSGLARRAGLDPTAFNKSKRFTADGRPRWPSTESVAKILNATGCDLMELVRLMDEAEAARAGAGLRARATGTRAAASGFADDGGTDALFARVESRGDRRVVEVGDEAMLPIYRPGDVLIVATGAEVRPGDRVILRLDGGPIEARTVTGHDGSGRLLCGPLAGGGAAVAIDPARVTDLARILWASQ